jgi:aspartate carbamoyltransferase regulatory subunit
MADQFYDPDCKCVVKQCTRCKEYWPADNEFYTKNRNKLHSWCKACQTEAKRERRETAIALA